MSNPGIDLWWFRLDPPGGRPHERAIALLDAAERARLRRFDRPQAARHFALRRVVRRIVLARYLGADPDELGFAEQCGAKPRLIAPWSNLEFSASDTAGFGVIAVSQSSPVGVDAEVMRTFYTGALARRVLSPAEWAIFQQTPGEADRRRTLLRAWTAKEAVLKGIGVGLDLGMMGRMTAPPMLGAGTWYEVGMALNPGDEDRWYVLAADLLESAEEPVLVTLASPAPYLVRVFQADGLIAKHGLV